MGFGISARPASALLILLAALLILPTPTFAKTILIDGNAVTEVAGLDESAPNMSLALYRNTDNQFGTNNCSLEVGRSLLIKFPLDAVPEGQRIAHAELIVPVTYMTGNQPRFYLWRMLANWGPGVCYAYRQTVPEKLEWTRPGAAGLSSDRATRPTDVLRLTKAEETVVNVTEDVELWHTDAAPNNGWLLTVEDPGIHVRTQSPIWPSPTTWRLRITYEPEPEDVDQADSEKGGE